MLIPYSKILMYFRSIDQYRKYKPQLPICVMTSSTPALRLCYHDLLSSQVIFIQVNNVVGCSMLSRSISFIMHSFMIILSRSNVIQLDESNGCIILCQMALFQRKMSLATQIFLDVSTKPRPEYSPSPPPSNEPNFNSITIIELKDKF